MIYKGFKHKTDARALERARAAWMSLAGERRRRARCKDFTYGRQWGDPCRSTDGEKMSEQERMAREGRLPVTNNIIRQMVKSIVGRYRYMCMEPPEQDNNPMPTAKRLDSSAASVSETDARALEEFLISGQAVQRLSPGEVENVSPARLFYEPFLHSNGSDCRMIGMLHDMSMAGAFSMFGSKDPYKARALKEALERVAGAGAPWPSGHAIEEFSTPGKPGTYRVIELWELQGFEYLEISEPGKQLLRTESVDALPRLEGVNRARAEVGSEPLNWEHKVVELWNVKWLTPTGEVLKEERKEKGVKHPFVLRFYPLIDGEIHSLVEDVIDQQKYVNRLISLLDHIISSSAKGVLLYPADQLPEGFTWRDLRRIWANPNGILPFKRTAKGMMPQQVTASGAIGSGATEMLKMQLQLFDQISGATGALSGRSGSATGEGMLRTELENALVSMLDVLASFRGFILEREKRGLRIKD